MVFEWKFQPISVLQILYVRRYTVHICICLLIGLVFALSTYHRPNMDGLMNNFQQFAADQFVKMKVSLISELENLNPDNITDASEQEVGENLPVLLCTIMRICLFCYVQI